VFEWIREHDALLWGLGIASVAVFAGSLLLIPALVVRIPTDYFASRRRPRSAWADRRPLVRWLIFAVKNLLGVVFIVAGIAMLVLPGQGVLTIVLGFLMLDGPGKYRAERWLVSRRAVLRSINWLRARKGREPLQVRAPRRRQDSR